MIRIEAPWSRHLTAALLLPLTLAGCGGDAESSASSAAQAQPPAQTAVPADKSAPTQPLWALVQSHRQRSGTSQAEAEQAVAKQLGIDVGQIHDYLQQPAVTFSGLQGIADNARTAAALLQKGLEQGVAPLLRVDSDVADESPRLTALNFQNATHYDFYLESTNGAVNAAGQLLWDPVYGGLIKGNPRSAANARTCYESVNGFHYTGREEYLRSRGNPARIEVASRNKMTALLQTLGLAEAKVPKVAMFEITLEAKDISNQSMADFVRAVQAREQASGFTVHHSLFTLNPQALGTATFPNGSRFYSQMRTHFVKAGALTNPPGFNVTLSCLGSYDLPKPAATLAGFAKPLRVKHSINATAWNAMKAALNIP